MGFLQTIGESIATTLKPILVEKADQLLTEVADTIKAEIQKHMPAIIDAIVKAVAATGANIAVHGADKLTDLIPGQLDDQILDPIVSTVVDEFRKRLGL